MLQSVMRETWPLMIEAVRSLKNGIVFVYFQPTLQYFLAFLLYLLFLSHDSTNVRI